MSNDSFSRIMFERKSIKLFDPNFKIPKDEMASMIEKATSAPSSVNMQPWRFIVVESNKMKEKLNPLVWYNTTQNDTSSAMVAIFGDMKCQLYSEKINNKAVKEGLMPPEIRDQKIATNVPFYDSFTEMEMQQVVSIDCSLAAMQFMLIARQHGYETNPIGGFDRDDVTELLGLDKERYLPIMIISIGKPMEEGRETTRLDVEDILSFI